MNTIEARLTQIEGQLDDLEEAVRMLLDAAAPVPSLDDHVRAMRQRAIASGAPPLTPLGTRIG